MRAEEVEEYHPKQSRGGGCIAHTPDKHGERMKKLTKHNAIFPKQIECIVSAGGVEAEMVHF